MSARETDPGRLARFGLTPEVALSVLVVLVVAMLVVPLPTALLDLLLVANLAVSLLLLLAALGARSALSMSSLPSLLLITTLFRLALNVSSTRLILLQADAGEVIRSFGEFVVQGNYAVGGVVFLVLTLVQYIVIARGSERVAEVAARFALDALPGRQMAIDAEVRAGALSTEEARHKRAELSRESSLFGALDGAMKFVKGDAIAGLVILVVNLVGGVVIGMTTRDLDLTASLRTYGLLTIGDGLVTQIPSLLVSTTAGVVVTRVASAEGGPSLAADMRAQLLGSPRTLGLAALLLGLLALVPGLPTAPFAVLAVGLGALALRERSRAEALERSRPARLRVSASADVLQAASRATQVRRAIAQVELELAVPLPAHRAELRDDPGRITIHIDDVVAVDVRLPPDRLVVRAASSALEAGAIESAALPVPGLTTIAAQDRARASSARIDVLEGTALVAALLEAAVVRDARSLIGPDETQVLVERLSAERPALVRQAMPRPLSLAALTEITQGLVAEGVPPRPLATVVEAASRSTERDPASRLEDVRVALARSITARFAPDHQLDVVELDPMIEDAIRDALTTTSTTTHLALAPALARDVVRAIQRVAKPSVALVVARDLRRHVRRLVERDLPGLPVLTSGELEPGVALRVVGRASV